MVEGVPHREATAWHGDDTLKAQALLEKKNPIRSRCRKLSPDKAIHCFVSDANTRHNQKIGLHGWVKITLPEAWLVRRI